MLKCLCQSKMIDGLFNIVEMEMERAVAVKKLRNLLGKKFGYRINEKAPAREQREEAKAELHTAITARNELQAKRDERQKMVLAADEEYQSLYAAARAARERTERLSGIMHSHKITVGINEGLFFLVKAEGDSWEEIIDKVAAKQTA